MGAGARIQPFSSPSYDFVGHVRVLARAMDLISLLDWLRRDIAS
jgi:hypothetical protein